MSNVFYRDPRHYYPQATRGEGVYLYDAAGHRYLDGSGGAAVSCLGHGHPAIIRAIQHQVAELAYAHTAFFTNAPQEKLAARLAQRYGEDDAKVYFVSGGSEANETAIKLVRQYWLARGKPDKTMIASRLYSYHGNTLGALSASGNVGRRGLFGPLLHDWPRIEPCYAYRHRRENETEEDYGRRAANALEDAILEHGADRIGAFIAETVVGATLGAVPGAAGYFRHIRDICDRHDILLILDEVMAGAGRAGTYFAFEQDGIRPDLVTIAKGLGGGYQPIGAVVAQSAIHDEIVEAFGHFEHGHTYIGHATACAAAMAVSDVLDDEELLTNVQRISALLVEGLKDAFGEHPNVGDVRGRGLLLGIELVADRATKGPMRPAVAPLIKEAAMTEGLIIYPGSGSADGTAGAHILLAPPFIYSPDNVDELIEKLGRALARVDLGSA